MGVAKEIILAQCELIQTYLLVWQEIFRLPT